MCRVLEVSRAGYYAWRDRRPSRRAEADIELRAAIETAYQRSRGYYGSPRIHTQLRRSGVLCARKRVARIMRQHGFVGKKRRQFRLRRADSRRTYAASPNLLARKFDPASVAPNSVWIGDITYIPTFEGWLYLAVVLDLHSRAVIGWAMDAVRDAAIVIDALTMAIAHRRPDRGTVFHSDRGSQYGCDAFRVVLAEHHFVQSMSRKGDCWDNAVAESFFATLKLELVEGARFPTRTAARAATFEYIEVWYNRQRLHSTLGFAAPADFERAGRAA
jgi:putative transposase